MTGLTGCMTAGEDYERPTETAAGPMDKWEQQVNEAISTQPLDPKVLASWWETLGDDGLTSLIERAAQANLDLRQAQAQLREARAQRKIAEAEGAPQVGLSAGAGRTGSGDGSSSGLYSAGIDASWELDLFGRVQRAQEAAEADLQASEEARRDVLVSVLAEVALNYIDLRTLQQRKALVQENLKIQEESLGIAIAQVELGEANPLDIDLARSNVETTRASIPTLDQAIEQSLNRLAVLIGKNPGEIDEEFAQVQSLPVPPVTIAVGVPAEVLRRRPDVRQSERQLAAQSARVGVAIAELYPQFTLGGTIGLESPSMSNLFNSASQLFSLGPRVQWTLYDGGRLREQIEVQDARQEQALITYEKTILISLEDVENAITAYTQEQIRYRSLVIASESATQAAAIAEARYQAGEIDFLSTLDAQRTRLDAQDAQAQSEGLIVGNAVRLYKSLGGGWDTEAADESVDDSDR